jgi:hypothetical protein
MLFITASVKAHDSPLSPKVLVMILTFSTVLPTALSGTFAERQKL